MPRGGAREGAGRPKMPNLCKDAHTFEIELYLRQFIKALGEGSMSVGMRIFVQRCIEMVALVEDCSPDPEFEVLLPNVRFLHPSINLFFKNLRQLSDLQTGGEYVRQREAMVHDKGGARKKVSVLLTRDQMAFLKTIGKGNARMGFRRLDELIYTTLGSIDSVTMAEYPAYNLLWSSYEELYIGYTRTVYQAVRGKPG